MSIYIMVSFWIVISSQSWVNFTPYDRNKHWVGLGWDGWSGNFCCCGELGAIKESIILPWRWGGFYWLIYWVEQWQIADWLSRAATDSSSTVSLELIISLPTWHQLLSHVFGIKIQNANCKMQNACFFFFLNFNSKWGSAFDWFGLRHSAFLNEYAVTGWRYFSSVLKNKGRCISQNSTDQCLKKREYINNTT